MKIAVLLLAIILGQDAVRCRYCKDTGWIQCNKHKKAALELEGSAIRCSELIECKQCGGTLRIPCTRCKLDLAAEIAAERAEMEKWLEKMREIDAYVGKVENVMHCESAHFILTFNLPKITSGRKAYNTHEAMHLYLERLEECYTDVCADLGATDKDFLAKTQVMIWRREREIIRSASKYCGQNSNTKAYLLGKAPIFTIYYNKNFMHEEFELHQAVVHNVVHCLLSNVWDGIWPGNMRGAWIDAGYAHHYELKYFKQHGGGVRNYCYQEGDTNRNFKFGKWRSSVRKGVDAGDAPPFVDLASKNLTNLTPSDHMYSWSLVDFLIAEHPKKFPEVARKIKQKKRLGDVMKEAMGMSPFQFEEAWKEFVQKEYPVKETKTLPPRWKRNKG